MLSRRSPGTEEHREFLLPPKEIATMADKIVRTERLELVDRRGRIRAVLACEQDSELPSCTFLDAEGQTRVIVGLSWNEIPQIQLTAPDGTARAALVVRPEGMGVVVLMDDQQRSKTIAPTDA